MNYQEWEAAVPEAIKADSLWKMRAYRMALFLADLGRHDVTRLTQDRRTLGLSDQLYRAPGSIGANLAEGYSRGTGKDRARFYEYALGSARESRDWYFKARHILGEAVATHSWQQLTEVIRPLLTMVPHQRGRKLREESIPYYAHLHDAEPICLSKRRTCGTCSKTSPSPTHNRHVLRLYVSRFTLYVSRFMFDELLEVILC